MTDSAKPKRKIAILGGGVGAMTTAFELTSVPGWQEQYEVTVYQLGWRLGGKGASGRNAKIANRIEEHGLHIWFGFYDNAFNVMRHVYQELADKKLAPDSPFQSCFDGFEPHQRSTLSERTGDGWKLWSQTFSEVEGLPGDDCLFDSTHPTQPPLPFDYLLYLMDWMVQRSDDDQRIGEQPADYNLPEWAKLLLEPIGLLAGASLRGIGSLLRLGQRLASWIGSEVERHTNLHFQLLHHLLSAVHDALGKGLEDAMEHSDDLRHVAVLLDFGLTYAKGIIADDVVRQGFAVIDQYDIAQWMARHGSKFPDSALVRGIYDSCFAYQHGDPATPSMAAACAVHGNLRSMFTYHKACMFRMKAAMGDTIFAPIYLVLHNRGVKFEFFRRVENLGLSDDHTTVDRIEMDIQATLKSGFYDPLITVNNLPAWPNAPLFDQLVEGEEIRDGDYNLESAYTEWHNRIGRQTLRRGTDFDEVVFAISLGSIPYICKELLAVNEKWRNMVQFMGTTQTQAMQLWLNRSAKEMGWDDGAKFPAEDRPMFSAYLAPFDTYVDFSQLIPREQWKPEDGLKQIAYLANSLADELPIPEPFTDPGFPLRSLARVKENGRTFLQKHAGVFWPAGCNPPGSGPLDWNLLVVEGGEEGISRLDVQYFRANIDPSERYVLSIPGTAQYRLESGKSGFAGLYLAGDWTSTDMNVGCVEAAVMSGRMASRAMCGYPLAIYCAFGGDVAKGPQ